MKENILYTLLFVLILLGTNLYTREHYKNEEQPQTYYDTVPYYDTIPYYNNVPKDSLVLDVQHVYLPYYDTIPYHDTVIDSVQVMIPIYQYHFQEPQYDLYVSGYRVGLDSIFVFAEKEIITIHEQTPVQPSIFKPRFGLGVQGGLTVINGKPTMYIGIGVSYNFINF